MVEHLSRFNNADYNFLTRDNAPRLYLPIISDPTMIDSDGDDIPDNEDLEPLKIFLHELLQKLELMEKYIDEYMPQFIGDSYLPQDYSPSNMRIATNILRNYGYGSDETVFPEYLKVYFDYYDGDIFELLSREFDVWKGDVTQWIKWTFTDGYSYPEFRNYINSKNPSVISFLKKYKLFDLNGNEIDFLHMLATLGAEMDGLIDPNLAGWAGDLQSSIQDVRNLSEDSEYTLHDINEVFYQSITGELNNIQNKSYKRKLTMPDLIADVDAQNMYNTYSEDLKLSSMIKHYYTYRTEKRFTEFVDRYGNIEDFASIVSPYTRGYHIILSYFALRSGSMNVTEQESDILCNVFTNLMEDKVNEESY